MIRGKYRTYILVDKRLSRGKAAAAVAQAVAKLMQKYNGESCLKRWTLSDYNKVICSVTSEEMKTAQQRGGKYIVVIDKAISDGEIATIFVPRKEWSRYFTFLPLFGSRSHHKKKTTVNVTVNYGGMGGYDL